MESSNPIVSLIGLWMFLQLVTSLALLLGGIYALFCLGRAANGLDRLASAVEAMVARQSAPAPVPGPLPGVSPGVSHETMRVAPPVAPNNGPLPGVMPPVASPMPEGRNDEPRF